MKITSSLALLVVSIVSAVSPLGLGQSSPAKPQPQKAGKTEIHNSGYRNPTFGFSYKVPFGWVDRTDDMQEETPGEQADSPPAAADNAGGKQAPPGPRKSQTLLAIFERPPGASGDTINTAVVIAAESLDYYPGVKTAADYFGPITDLAGQRGFKVVNEPYSFSIGAKHLVRGDFSKERGKLTMWQSSLVMIEKGYIVSFMFMGGSEDDIEDLITGLDFALPVHTSGRRK